MLVILDPMKLPDPQSYPDLDPVDYPRHNPRDGEHLSDDRLRTLLWFFWKRRPTDADVERWKSIRGLYRWGWLKYSGITPPPGTKTFAWLKKPRRIRFLL